MQCSKCGADLPDGAKFCHACGAEQEAQAGSGKGKRGGRVGYSEKIHDPAFQKYLKNTNRWSSIFAGGLAVIAVAGFFIAGETGAGGMENPESLYIGLGIGGHVSRHRLLPDFGQKKKHHLGRRGHRQDGEAEAPQTEHRRRQERLSTG
ncbi:zinc-ribbon domain-containing protein [Aminivibrio sp.]|uniref:zinc ribbon domain-containing protein n=1 Tax=Aminivibrio sp. TaxID=1872489 RepID=UPI003D95C29A